MEYQIEDVCRRMLDNANLSVDLSRYPRVTLKFIVQGSVDGKFWEVRFNCDHVVDLYIRNDDNIGKNDLHLVLETSVVCKQKRETDIALQERLFGKPLDMTIWLIHIYGHMALDLVCSEFSWSTTELSVAEYRARFA